MNHKIKTTKVVISIKSGLSGATTAFEPPETSNPGEPAGRVEGRSEKIAAGRSIEDELFEINLRLRSMLDSPPRESSEESDIAAEAV